MATIGQTASLPYLVFLYTVYIGGSMNRREYLAGFVGGVAAVSGCITSTPKEQQTPKEQTPDAKTATGSGRRSVSVVGTETEGIKVDAEMLESTVTKGHTAKVRLTWTNSGSQKTSVSIGRESAEPLTSHTIKNGDWQSTGLVLVPLSYDPQKRSEACWKPEDYFGGGGDAESTTLTSGESFRHKYRLWTDPDKEECLPAGEYDFGHFGDFTPSWRVTLRVEKS